MELVIQASDWLVLLGLRSSCLAERGGEAPLFLCVLLVRHRFFVITVTFSTTPGIFCHSQWTFFAVFLGVERRACVSAKCR